MSQPPEEPRMQGTATPSWATYQPDANKSELPPPPVPYGPPTDTVSSVSSVNLTSSSSRSWGRLRLIGAIVPVAVFVIGGGYAIKQISDSVDSVTSPFANDTPVNVPDGKPPPDVLSPGGYADLLDAVRTETGGTLAYGATIYPDYALLDLPVDAGSRRESSWFYDGTLRETDFKATSDSRRFDLADIDPASLTRLVRRAKALVDSPNTSYVIIDGPGGITGEPAFVRAYANNEFHEGAYVTADLTGKIIDKTKF